MPRRDGAPRRHPVLRRTLLLLWCQLGAGLLGLAAVVAALSLGGPIRMVSGWWPLLDPLVTTAAAAALLVYVLRAGRPRRAVLIAVLLLPAVVYVADSLLGPVGTGTGMRSGEFGWFAYTANPAATVQLLEITMRVLTAGLWAAMLAKLASVVNAVLLILPASRDAFRPAAPPPEQPQQPDT